MISASGNAQNNVGIGTSMPDSSALLDLNSTNKGVLVPRMSTIQRSSLPSPANGLLVYDNDTKGFWYFNGVDWKNLAGSSTGISFPFDTTVNSQTTPFIIKNTGIYTTVAIKGENPAGYGLLGRTATGHGVEGSASDNGIGVRAYSVNGTGILTGSTNGSAIQASNSNINPAIQVSSSAGYGILATSNGTAKAGVRGEGLGTSNGLVGVASDLGAYGVHGINMAGTGVYGFSSSGTGIRAFSGSGLALDVIGKLKISGGNTNPSAGAVLTSDANGNAVWKNNKIGFCLRGINSNFNNMASDYSTKVHWTNETYDYGNDYALLVGTNPTSITSTFTVPLTGVYHFDAQVMINSQGVNSADIKIMYSRNGVTNVLAYGTVAYWPDNDGVDCSVSNDVRLIAGDIIWVEASHSNDDQETGYMAISGFSSFFNCHLVFAE